MGIMVFTLGEKGLWPLHDNKGKICTVKYMCMCKVYRYQKVNEVGGLGQDRRVVKSGNGPGGQDGHKYIPKESKGEG